MCITSEDVRSQEEALIGDILCDECVDKAIKLLEERKAYRLFAIDIEEYRFCSNCTGAIKCELERLAKAEFGDEIP
jgi:hypothetical protein